MVPVPSKVQSGFACTSWENSTAAGTRFQEGRKHTCGLSGLFRGPDRRVDTDLNTSSVRVIYIITMLALSAVQVTHVGISPIPRKHKARLLWPVIPLSIHLQTAHACWDATDALQEATRTKFSPSIPIIRRGVSRPWAGNFSLHITHVLYSTFALQ